MNPELEYLRDEETRLRILLADATKASRYRELSLINAEAVLKRSRKHLVQIEENYRTMRNVPIVSIQRYRETAEARGRYTESILYLESEVNRWRGLVEESEAFERRATDSLEGVLDAIEARSKACQIYRFRRSDDR